MEPGHEAIPQRTLPRYLRGMIPLLWAIVILSVVFAFLIFVVPLDHYRLAGNFFEAAVAIFCMACCLYLYCTVSAKPALLLAAFAFFSYALANTFWYLFSLVFGRLFATTIVNELGFFAFFLLFIAAITLEFPDRGISPLTSAALIVIFLVIPVMALWAGGDQQPIRFTILVAQFILIEQLIATAIRHRVQTYTLLWAGLGLHCLGTMLYVIRDTLISLYTAVPLFPATTYTASLTVYDFLSIVGPMIICSFALIQIGLIRYVMQGPVSPGCPEPC